MSNQIPEQPTGETGKPCSVQPLTTPGYLDTAAKPAQRTQWRYRASFRVGDHRVGVWSDTVRVDVGGQ